MVLIFKGTKDVRQYRGDGLNCQADFPNTCKIDVTPEHGHRLVTEHPEWWVVPKNSEDGLAEMQRRAAALDKVSGKIRLRWLGSRKQQYYRGDGLSCDAEDPQKQVVNVSERKARQLLNDHPKLWKLLDDMPEGEKKNGAGVFTLVEEQAVPQKPKFNFKLMGPKFLHDKAEEIGLDWRSMKKAELIQELEDRYEKEMA